jgi:hypothetical protein
MGWWMRPELAALSPAERARTLLSTAKAELNGRLWQAALGSAGRDTISKGEPAPAYLPAGGGLEALLRAVMEPGREQPTAPRAQVPPSFSASPPLRKLAAAAPYASHLDAASARTGIPAATLSAIVNAEAGRAENGAWNPLSRNPRSSAAGLGQFLSGTWLGLARQAGTWLNAQARATGLVDAEGRIAHGAQSALLALRYDPQAAIETVADYARANVARLRQAGASIGENASEIARAPPISGTSSGRAMRSASIMEGWTHTVRARCSPPRLVEIRRSSISPAPGTRRRRIAAGSSAMCRNL